MARYGSDFGQQRYGRPRPARYDAWLRGGYAADFFGYGPGADDFQQPYRPMPPRGYGAEYGMRRAYDRAFAPRGWAMQPSRPGPDAEWARGPRYGAPGYGRGAPVRTPHAGRPTGPQPPNPQRTSEPPVRVAEIMTEEPDAVTVNTTVAVAARKMKDLDVGIIPVVDNLEDRHLRGVITDRDLAIRVLAEGRDGKTKVSSCMTTDVETCGKYDTVADVVDVMRSERVRRVPITDDDGRLVGIVAQADLAVRYAGVDFDREIEIEEAIERISEPARREPV
jgi:CBS domain-containing protein